MSVPEGTSSVAIIDCGGQYTKVIDRRVRELSVYSEILPLDVDPVQLQEFDAVILSGGPSSVYAEGAPAYDPGLLDSGKPLLGICYGMQLLTQHFGGEVAASGEAEYGVEEIAITAESPLFHGLDDRQRVLMSHGDSVQELPDGFSVIARSERAIAAIAAPERGIYGVQFHPEVDLSENGVAMLRNFLVRIALLQQNYQLSDRIENAVADIRAQVKDNKVFVLVSGGVDSAVTAALLLKALPAGQVYALHVDTGFMRLNESEGVVRELRGLGLSNLRHVNAADRFFDSQVAGSSGDMIGPLTHIFDPEQKRELVGNMFMEVLRDELSAMDLDLDSAIFAQGTLRPDLIESGNPGVSSSAQSIKTHHNDVSMVRRAREEGRVVETNSDWHKDEVRQVARQLGLSEAIAGRQPFPGPGLVLRVITWDGSDEVPSELDSRIRASLGETGLATVRTLPFRTVGVQGDYRSYRFLTLAETTDLTDPLINRLGQRIAGEFSEVNRVAMMLAARAGLDSLQPWRSTISREQVALLQQVDHRAREVLADMPSSQLFCLILPFGSAPGRFTVALRSIITNDYMTGRHTRPEDDYPAGKLAAWAAGVLEEFPQVDAVVYDVTGKPPGTVEWQ